MVGLNANLTWPRDTITLIMLSGRSTEGQLALFANFIRPNFLVINAAESKPVPGLGWVAGGLYKGQNFKIIINLNLSQSPRCQLN